MCHLPIWSSKCWDYRCVPLHPAVCVLKVSNLGCQACVANTDSQNCATASLTRLSPGASLWNGQTRVGWRSDLHTQESEAEGSLFKAKLCYIWDSVSRSQRNNDKNNKDSDTVSQFKLSEDQMRKWELYNDPRIYLLQVVLNVNHFSSEKAATNVYNAVHGPSLKKKKNFYERQTKLNGLSLISFTLCIATTITGKFSHCCSIWWAAFS